MTDLLFIGAGLGALACAGDLGPVTVLDKGRAPSGRAATRRLGGATLDHGARFFTARTPRLRALAGAGVEAGWLRVWARGFPIWEGGRLEEKPDGHPRYAPTAGLRELGRRLYAGEVQSGVKVTVLRRRAGAWEVEAEDGRTWQARRVALNLPAPQAAALLGDVAPALAAELAQITYQPCWAVGAVLERDLDVTWPALYTRHPALDWIAREHTKRPGTAPALMLHAGPEWTRAHLDTPPGEVARLLLAAAAEVVGEPIQAQDTFAHRWLYAQPVTRHPAPFLWDPALGLGLCGDGFTPDEAPSRVEAALLSGWGLAALLQHS